ncbi:Uncharacterised protein [Yersinia massiliensis]|nr:Uncharacterised protein [Yersinia massiliensis]
MPLAIKKSIAALMGIAQYAGLPDNKRTGLEAVF